MLRIERYLFRTVANAFLASLATLTAILWVTQSLKSLDLMTSKGQTILVFLTVSSLGLPYFIANIMPVALFASVVYSLNKLNGDSELVVMSAAGVSPARILRPFLALFLCVFIGAGALYLKIMPMSFDAITSLMQRIHGDFIANFARPGPFVELETGFFFHYRERGPDGSLRGVFIQDDRNPEDVATYIAERGDIVEKNGESYLLLEKGSTQHPRGSGDSSIITFDDYAIDLAQFVHRDEGGVKHPRERDTWSLLTADNKHAPPNVAGLARAEIFDRFVTPFYAFAAGLIAFAALGEARTTRQGRSLAIGASILLFIAVRIAGIVDSLLLRGKGGALPPAWVPIMAWVIPLGAAMLCLDYIFDGPISRGFSALRGRSLRLRRKT